MEMKTYRRYTKPVTTQDAFEFSEMKPKTVSGRATYVKSEHGRLSMKLNGNSWSIEHDDVVKEAAKHLAGRDQIEVTYWYDRWNEKIHVISFANYTKNVTVINQKLFLINSHLQEVRAQRDKHHQVINKAAKNGDIFILVKRSFWSTEERECYDLVDIRGANGFDTYDTVIDMLNQAGINDTTDQWVKCSTPLGCLKAVPGHENYLFGAFRTTEKRQACSCGANAWENGEHNHSIIVGCGSFRETYYCEYCFFDEMHIQVPKKFFSEDRISA